MHKVVSFQCVSDGFKTPCFLGININITLNWVKTFVQPSLVGQTVNPAHRREKKQHYKSEEVSGSLMRLCFETTKKREKQNKYSKTYTLKTNNQKQKNNQITKIKQKKYKTKTKDHFFFTSFKDIKKEWELEGKRKKQNKFCLSNAMNLKYLYYSF